MATAKKPASKKPVTKSTTKAAVSRKAPVKKTVAAKSPVKKAAPKKTVAKTPAKKTTTKKSTTKAAAVRSFRVAKPHAPFTEFRITKQTVYWIILVAFIIFAQLWILNLHVEVASLIEAQQSSLQEF